MLRGRGRGTLASSIGGAGAPGRGAAGGGRPGGRGAPRPHGGGGACARALGPPPSLVLELPPLPDDPDWQVGLIAFADEAVLSELHAACLELAVAALVHAASA